MHSIGVRSGKRSVGYVDAYLDEEGKQMNKMNKFERHSGFVPWLMALLLSALAAGCGGGGGSAILGGGETGGIAPQVTVVAPLPNATGVPTNTKVITAAFTKAMDSATLTSTTFTLACPAGTAVTGTVTYVTASSVATLTLPGSTTLPSNTVCTATVTTGAKDTAGIALASNFAWTFTTGVTPDTTAPTVTGTIQANGETGVAVNVKVGATFSEAMDPLTITTTTFTLKQGTTAVSGAVTYSGVNAVFAPTSTLAASTTYTATITTGAKDLAGNALASDFTWSWTTGAAPDTTAPTVTGTVNASGATNVAINTRPGVTFSEAMDPLTITGVNFVLTETVSGNVVPGAVSYSGVNAVFVPLVNLANSRGYTVTVKSGASGVKDLAGNPMAADFVNSWTTGAAPDITAPKVTTTDPVAGATGVTLNTKVAATFSEAMDPLTMTNVIFTLKATISGAAVTGTVSYSGVTAVFAPLSGSLAASTNYTATVKGGASGAKDLAGNALASDFVWTFTTGPVPDTTAPLVTGNSPANGATGVPLNAKMSAAFSEAMNPLTITNLTFTTKETISGAAVAGLVSYIGGNAVFAPAKLLNTNQGYTSTIKGGAGGAKDLAGNAVAKDFVWTWTTAAGLDTSSPTITNTNPANGTDPVATNSSVQATFSEEMDPLSINFNLECPGGTNIVASSVIYLAGSNVVTFTPAADLPGTTVCTAEITGAKDLAGNQLASGAVPNPWQFTTGVAPVPELALTLNSATTFGIAAGAGLTSTGITVVNGDVALSPTATCSDATGLPGDCTLTPNNRSSATGLSVNGTIYFAGDGFDGGITAAGVKDDLTTAWNEGLGKVATLTVLGDQLASIVPYPPGIYLNANLNMAVGGEAILDGTATDVWIFQVTTDFSDSGILANPSRITLTGGALARNVWFVIGNDATIGNGTTWRGNLLVGNDLTINTGSSVLGRALSGAKPGGAGAISLKDGASITVP